MFFLSYPLDVCDTFTQVNQEFLLFSFIFCYYFITLLFLKYSITIITAFTTNNRKHV